MTLTAIDAGNLPAGTEVVIESIPIGGGTLVITATRQPGGLSGVATTFVDNAIPGTSGGIVGYTSTTVTASSVLLTQYALVVGGGAGATPVPLASLGTSVQVLHGAAAGPPTWGPIALAADVSGVLPVANGGTGSATPNSVTLVAGTSYTLLASDSGHVINFTSGSAVTLTVPAGLGAGFNCVLVQSGAGAVTPTASSTTINARQSFVKTAGQYAVCSLVATAANVFVFGGDGAVA